MDLTQNRLPIPQLSSRHAQDVVTVMWRSPFSGALHQAFEHLLKGPMAALRQRLLAACGGRREEKRQVGRHGYGIGLMSKALPVM